METITDPINGFAKEHFGIDYVFPYQRLVISNILRSASIKGFQYDNIGDDESTPEQIVLLPTGKATLTEYVNIVEVCSLK